MAQDFVVFGRRFGDSGDWLFGNDQGVNWRLRLNIAKSQHQVVFINNVRGNFAGDDFLEQGFAHAPAKLLPDSQNVKPYSTSSVQFEAATSAERHVRRKSTMWSWSCWHRAHHRSAPVRRLTQPRSPENLRTSGDCRNCKRNSSRNRGKKNSSHPP